MKNYETIANEVIANKLNRTCEFVPVTTSLKLESGKKPHNGAYVLVHNWEDEVMSSGIDGEEGYDTWEVVRWFDAGTVADAGITLEENKEWDCGDDSDSEGEKTGIEKGLAKLIHAIKDGKKATQIITEDGFYWEEHSDTWAEPTKYHKINLSNIDCWCELPNTDKGKVRNSYRKLGERYTVYGEGCGVSKGKSDEKEVAERGVKKTAKDEKVEKSKDLASDEVHELKKMLREQKYALEKEISEKLDEVWFQRKYRLADGSLMTVKTIPSMLWKSGKKLPGDVGAFEWSVEDREGETKKNGKFSARFTLPEEGENWNVDNIAAEVVEYVLEKEYGIAKDKVVGLYSIIG